MRMTAICWGLTVVAWMLLSAVFFGCEDASRGACDGRECGLWEGQDCGTCTGTDYCNPLGRCEDACAGRQCGVWHGVYCGECPDGWECIPWDGSCVVEDPPGPPDPPPCWEEFGPNGEICINGYAHWLWDDQGGEGAFMGHRIMDPNASADSTFIVVEVYDPLAYANDPDNTVPLAATEVNPQEGTFRVTDIAVPSQGLVLMVVSDIDNDASDLFTFTGVPFPAVSYEHLREVVAFGATHEQVDRWSGQIGQTALAATGCPEPPGGGLRTLSSCGTWIPAYVMLEGVVPEDSVGPVPPHKTFYPGVDASGQLVFDDPTECVVWSDDQGPHEWTGILGSVFAVFVPLGNMSGHCQSGTQCAEATCLFAQILGGAIQDALFVQFIPQVLCSNWPPEDTQCATGM